MPDKEKALAISALLGIVAACMSMAEEISADEDLALNEDERNALNALQASGLVAAQKLVNRCRALLDLPAGEF